MVFATRLVKVVGVLLAATVAQGQAQSSDCTDVHVVFARGSTEAAGLGICGTPLVSGIKNSLNGMTVSSYAVNYLADAAQTSAGPGATDMTNHVVKIAAQCPKTVFVIGGYSQGGSVTDISIGIKTTLGTGKTIPTELAPRIKAVVVFGNPLKLFGQTIATASPAYGSKAIEYCNTGDPVCGAGANMMAHLTYASDGSVAKAAQRAAALVKSGASDSNGATTDDTSGQSAATPTPSSSASAGTSGGISGLLPSGGASGISGLLPSGGASGTSGGLSGLSGLSNLIPSSGTSGGGISSLFGGGGSTGTGTSGFGLPSLSTFNFGSLRGTRARR